MVVSWNEKPTLSPASTMRLLRHWPSSETTSRSVPVISSVVRTIMFFENPYCFELFRVGTRLRTSGANLRGRPGQDVEDVFEFVVGDRQRRELLDHLVVRSGGFGQQTLL